MTWPLVEVQIETSDSGGIDVRCPGPGKVRWQRSVGEGVGPGSRLGLLRRDERTYELVLPSGARGRVCEVLLVDPWTRCEHGQLLSRLGLSSDPEDDGPAASSSASSSAEEFEVRSPTHGTFYRRPSPDSDWYVEPGRKVLRGQVLGLVEVMKCFSPIVFEPPPGVERGVVRDIVPADGSEVRSEETLLRIELLPDD